MKILPPTMRQRKRYLAFELISKEKISRDELIRELFASMGSLLGDSGSSECGMRLLTFEDSKGIIQCAHTRTEQTRASIATITNIGGRQVLINVFGISGTVATATEKYLEGVKVFNLEEQSHINW